MNFTYKVTARNLFRYKARMFMTSGDYKHVFGEQYQSNAYLVRLKNHETSNVESRSAKLMKLDGVKGIVQNTTSKKQVATIVDSLDQIMEVLILVAGLLAVVILYNLTNLNVSERIHELSTIKVLGFHSNETTMYIYRAKRSCCPCSASCAAMASAPACTGTSSPKRRRTR